MLLVLFLYLFCRFRIFQSEIWRKQQLKVKKNSTLLNPQPPILVLPPFQGLDVSRILAWAHFQAPVPVLPSGPRCLRPWPSGKGGKL